MGTVVLIAIWSEAGITDDRVQLGSWGLYGVLVLWRVWRLGAVLTPERVTVRGFFVDHHYAWDQVAGLRGAPERQQRRRNQRSCSQASPRRSSR
ncbi:PH domain-containing protein [Kribbella endophytica]